QYQGDAQFAEAPKQTYMFLPSGSTVEERLRILSTTDNVVCLGGSAGAGTMSPPLGKIDIGESDDSYLFRVSLPGVAREDFTCDVSPDGQ
ncbi:Hsp20/alpha crystallin family protein, partial [Mycobacterium kansasii]